jgi:tripartite-type tricarboxylate transporter receptor subunit TctC
MFVTRAGYRPRSERLCSRVGSCATWQRATRRIGVGLCALSQSLYKQPPYNTITDFSPVSLVVESPRTLITPKTFPANSLPEFIEYVKANQTVVKYGSAGVGSASHVSCVLFNAAIGINVTHVHRRRRI